MNTYVLHCASEEALNTAMTMLRETYKITGEFHAKQRASGGWRLTLHSEQLLTADMLAALPVETQESTEVS